MALKVRNIGRVALLEGQPPWAREQECGGPGHTLGSEVSSSDSARRGLSGTGGTSEPVSLHPSFVGGQTLLLTEHCFLVTVRAQ